MSLSPIKLAVLISGSGTTLQNFIDRINQKQLDAQINLVIGSRPQLRGVERATQAGIKTEVVERALYPDLKTFSERVFYLIDQAEVDLVCLAGWLCLLDLPEKYHGRVMNIHPALLPSFGGKGMYGARVHQAVLNHGCKISGCTVHFVDSAYDSGPIILQRACPVLDNDTPASLANRVFEEEKIAYPQAIKLFAAGRLKLEGRRVVTGDS